MLCRVEGRARQAPPLCGLRLAAHSHSFTLTVARMHNRAEGEFGGGAVASSSKGVRSPGAQTSTRPGDSIVCFLCGHVTKVCRFDAIYSR